MTGILAYKLFVHRDSYEVAKIRKLHKFVGSFSKDSPTSGLVCGRALGTQGAYYGLATVSRID